MSSSLQPWQIEGNAMLKRLEPYLTAEQANNLTNRLTKWEKKTALQSQQTATPTPSATLPILVMRPRSLPQTVDPFYFALENQPNL
jgi:hypothetical protein